MEGHGMRRKAITLRIAAAAIAGFLCLLSACATPGAAGGRKFFLEDPYARYYHGGSGKVLRVEEDGTVLDVTCLPIEFVKDMPRQRLPEGMCDHGKLQVLGRARKAGDDWDMSAYVSAPEAGGCKSLMRPLTRSFDNQDWDAPEEDEPQSCWNLLWEVPTSIVVYPTVTVLFVGVVTSPVWAPLIFLH